MNKNKLSRFLLSTSVGILTLGFSEVSADNALEIEASRNAVSTQAKQVANHLEDAIVHLKDNDSNLSDEEASKLAKKIVLHPAGLVALNSLGSDTEQLFSYFREILTGGVDLTSEHFSSFASQISDVSTLRALGVENVRELKSPVVERLATPSQITTIKNAEYFAELRKDSGEFEAAAAFFLKARELTEATNITKRTEYAESALLMYSEHFIHHVAMASSVTEANVTAAQTLLASVKALAETTATAKALLRAANCAEQLSKAIYDLAVVQKAAKATLAAATTVDTAAVTAAGAKAAKTFVSLYSADIVARDLHVKASAIYTGQDKNSELVAAANAMRLAIGALADAQAVSSTAVFDGDVTVAVKLSEEAIAFKGLYTELASTSGVIASEALKTSAATAKILLSKFKATWNARSAFDADTANRNALNTQYSDLDTLIKTELDMANTRYTAITSTEHYLSARDIATVRSVNAERLYRVVLDKAAVAPINEGDVTAAVTALSTYVTSSVKDVVTGMDDALKATLDEVKASAIRSARTDCNRTLAAAYALIAKATSTQLIKNTAALVTDRDDWLVSFLTNARLANNKDAWEAGVEAADKILAVAAIATPTTDDARLVKALALTVKAEALLKRNTEASDTLVATVDSTNALTAGILFDAKTVADAMAAGDKRVTANDHLRKAFESAVELHNSATVKQGLRTAWAAVEEAYAIGKLTIADTALNVAIATNSSVQQQNGDTWAAIVACFNSYADAEAVKDAIRTSLFGVDGAGAQTIRAAVDTMAARRAALVADTLAKFFNDKDQVIGTTIATPADHAWYTVKGLYDDLKAEFDRITALSTTPYAGYAAAAAAFDKARTAKADWAAAEVAGLATATAATWAAKRDAAGAAYSAAADYETKRAGSLLSAAGIGLSTAYDSLAKIAGLTASLATEYVTEGVLTSLHRRALNLKDAAATYNRNRAAVGTDAAIDANKIQRNAAIHKSVRVLAANHAAAAATEAKPIVTGAEADGTGAFELGLDLVNTAYQGLAGFSADSDFGTFAAERLAEITTAYRKVMTPWLSDLTATLALAITGTDAADHKAALQALVQAKSAVGTGLTVNGTVTNVGTLSGNIYKLTTLLDSQAVVATVAANGGNVGIAGVVAGAYVSKHSVRRDVALSYDMVLRTLVALATTDANLETHQTHVYNALVANATAAKAIDFTDYVAATGAATETQMNAVITQLTQRADLAEAPVAAAFGALRSNTPSDTTKSFKAARAQAITELTGLIQEGALDLANVVLNEENPVATADLKAKAAHQLARVLMAKAAAERIRFDNLGAVEDKANALTWYKAAVTAYNQEITAILSQTDSSLMANRNTRLSAAYESLAEAYKQAIVNGADAAWVKEQYTATFNQAQIIYREGKADLAAEMLEGLTNTAGAAIVHGSVLRELAEQFEAAGKFLKSAKAYKASAQNHVANKAAAEAYEAAENALKAAQQSGHAEAYLAAAEAFKLIGSEGTFHGRVRAEAYSKSAEAYLLGSMNEDAADAYNASGAGWANIGDHMQAGNQHENAAWALSQLATITVDQQIKIIQAVEKAAHQLQVADATSRLEKLVDLAEEQITKIQAAEDSITAGKLKAAVIAAAGALYEKALAFQKEGDLSHAEAAEARIIALLKIVDSTGKEAGILVNVAKIYSLQNKHALAVETYIKAAESFVEGKELLKAANAYADAADSALAARVGNRVKDEILPELLKISASVRADGDNAGSDDQFDIHLAVVEVYRDLANLNPSEIDAAIAEVVAIEALAPSQKDMQARVAGVKIDLLSQKAKTLKSSDQKVALLQQAQASFDAIKGLTGETTVATVKVKKFVAIAANSLVKLYELTRVIHTTNGLAYLAAFRAVVDTAEAAAVAAYEAASKIKMSYDVALEASTEASKAMTSYTKAMLHYIVDAKDKARPEDMVHLLGMPDRMAKIVENAVRATLLGILKSREEAAVIKSNFAAVMNASSLINTYIVALRKNEASRDSYGDAGKATDLKATIATNAATVRSASGDLAIQAAGAHIMSPVARAAATDKLVAEKAEAAAKAVATGVGAQAELVKRAPAADVGNDDIANHAEEVMKAVVGDGKATGGNTSGLAGELQKAQTGPSTQAAAVSTARG